MERCLVGAEDAHPIGTSNPGQCEAAKLDQVPQATAGACNEDIALGPVVIDKCKAWKLAKHDSDVKGGQVAVNKAGKVQTPDLSAKCA